MTRLFFIIVSSICFIFLAFWGLTFYELKYEKINKDPCVSSADLLGDSLSKKYKIWGSGGAPKNYCFKCLDFDSTKVECNIITCRLRFEEPGLNLQDDSIIKSFAKIFWSFEKNKNVDSLYLHTENNGMSLYSPLSKSDAINPVSYSINALPNKMPQIKVIREFNGSELGGGGNYERYTINTFVIDLNASHDFPDFQTIADSCYHKYLQNGKLKDIATFYINIDVHQPEGKLVSEKTCSYIYPIIPYHFYIKPNKN